MTNVPTGQGPNPLTASSERGHDRLAAVVIAAVGFATGAIAGAYLNWIWWEIGYRPLAVILAVAILVVGGIVSIIRRVIMRRIALGVVAVGFGLLVGQAVGPVREPLINQPGGSMTLRLDSPAVAVASGSVECQNVASETEFLVVAVPEVPPGQLGLPDAIVVQLGDRWAYPRDNSRTDRVRLEIGVTTQLVPGSIKVQSRIGMEASESSTLESTFSNAGGSIRFGDLVALDGPGYTGESMDLVGTFVWTCGAPLP